jgi:hypothetical protein
MAVMSADSPYLKPPASMVLFGGVGGFLFSASVFGRIGKLKTFCCDTLPVPG